MPQLRWQASHNLLAKREFARIKKAIDAVAQKNKSLPQLPQEFLKWVYAARPVICGKTRTFLDSPFWEEIYRDDSAIKMIIGGRQTRKSSYFCDLIAHAATTNPGTQTCYVTFDQPSMNSFSKQRLQIETFGQSLLLSKFPRNRLGNIGEISLKNESTIYCTTDNYQYKHVEGKSPIHVVLDEAQYQDIQFFPKVLQTMMATHGRVTIAGIGGDSGSPYEKLWRQTDQREWFYHDPNWRDNLQFDEKGLVVEEYLKNVLKGKFIAQKPENLLYRGYHIPQTIFPAIPLTIDDAVSKYKIHPIYSIEYQKKHNTDSFFVSNCLGEFYKSDSRPVTWETAHACMEPYYYFGLSSPQEIAEWKDIMQDQIKISMGVDFGSGKQSHTVISILIHWKKSDRLHLAYLDKRPSEHQLDQAELINKIFRMSKCDIGVADLGYGANQVKLIQDGGANRITGEPFPGLTESRFIGCRTTSDETRPIQLLENTTDEHGDKIGRITIDKTSAVQEFVDMLGVFVPHPVYQKISVMAKPRLMIPFKNQYEVDWLVNDFTNITRRDLEINSSTGADPRQNARKMFNHPKDSVMSIIYAITGLKNDLTWYYF